MAVSSERAGGAAWRPVPLLLAWWGVVSFLLWPASQAQYREGSPRYVQEVERQEVLLDASIKDLPDLVETFLPEKKYFNPNTYRFEEPTLEDYKIGLIIDPCKGEDPSCCMNVYGMPEYGLKLVPDTTYSYRVVTKFDLGDENEILDNVQLVDEYRNPMPASSRRRADDKLFLKESCDANGDPTRDCTGFRLAERPFPHRPACMDNNITVNATARCYDPATDTWADHCVQVAYMQTAFSMLCGNEFADDPHCGTYLEVHLPNGSPIYDKTLMLGERKITSRNTTGYTTTTIPLYFTVNVTTTKDPLDRYLLCNYIETSIRVGTVVLIKDTAPRCCCPGSFHFCPRLVFDSGPEAVLPTSISQKLQVDAVWSKAPYCYSMPRGQDWVMCSKAQTTYNRVLHYRCPFVNQTANGYWNSPAINSSLYYEGQCPYFPECVLGFDNGTDYCDTNEQLYTFVGKVGTVTSVPADPDTGYYGVTLNNGRSVYYFKEDDLIMDSPSYNYEVWWVQRTRYDFVIQKKKPFRVTTPTCTYDALFERFHPYAILKPDGTIVDTTYT